MVVVQGRNRPCIQVLAVVDPALKTKLEDLFASENLFKRSAYSNGFPASMPQPTGPLAPHVAALLKSDACPEITVKTILQGQLLQASSVWEMKAFEYVAQRAFDSLVEFCATVVELGRETIYAPPEADRFATLEMPAAPVVPAIEAVPTAA
ncbi:MAG: hypothetical protein B7Y80_13235 [Hyphomicrobium sp. 32-62-53]|nr:MAG: hypothetical protein B7Z29_12985 [Hyphomicrobium sp. 12-62-95]OYX98995.1 MAG: hypothetical protein B7Y80_13235 [Hyphomicrobium sp. 32-62-53]